MASKRKPQKPASEPKTQWDRDQFSVRLTEARRARLLLISAAMADGSTPNDAVDRAVEIALAKPAPASGAAIDVGSRFDDLEELIVRMGRERELDAASQRATADEALREARSMSAVITAIAAMPNGEESDDYGAVLAQNDKPKAAEVPSLKAWLDARAGSAKSMTLVARWRSKSKLSDRLVAMEFDAEVPEPHAARSVFRLGPIDATSPLAATDQGGAFTLACRRGSVGGWEISVHRMNADSSAGAALGRLRI